ncbi:MAG: nitroreductase family protein [Desulfobacterales bacterium]|nr:nitroreductase family protein [Desulfobacterales bacterium]
MSTIKELVIQNRSCRRFFEEVSIPRDTLEELVDLARLSPSAANMQPLKYIISNDELQNELIFPCLAWAAYLKDWSGPVQGERPSAYIVILGDQSISTNFWCDHGIACQSILLGAREKGFAGCIMGAINKDKLRESLHIPDYLTIMLVIALGKPKEHVQIEPVKNNDIRYWRDENGVHHVPKRDLKDIIVQ